MAVAVDATGTKLVGGSSAVTSLNYTGITVGASLTNGALVAWLMFGDASTPTGFAANWDNTGAPQAMTVVGSVTFTGTGGTVTAVAFARLNPTSGNKTLAFSWTGTGNFPTACAISMTGVNQTSVAAAFKNFVSNTGNVAAAGDTLSTTVTSAVGDMVIGGFADALSLTGINNTSVFTDTTSSGADTAGCRAAGAATVTVTGTGGSGSGAGVVWGFDVAAAGAASFIAPRPLIVPQSIIRASYW